MLRPVIMDKNGYFKQFEWFEYSKYKVMVLKKIGPEGFAPVSMSPDKQTHKVMSKKKVEKRISKLRGSGGQYEVREEEDGNLRLERINPGHCFMCKRTHTSQGARWCNGKFWCWADDSVRAEISKEQVIDLFV